MPKGLQDLSSVFSAPLGGYNIPLPFFSDANAELWHAAIGYEITGSSGCSCAAAVDLRDRPAASRSRAATVRRPGMLRLTTSAGDDRLPARAGARPEGRVGWVEKTLAGITASIEQAVFTERHARSDGWLQRVDPRAKLGMFLAGRPGRQPDRLARRRSSLLYAALLVAAKASRIPFDFFVRRVWSGIPFFAGIVVIPAIFIVQGPRLFELTIGPLTIAPSTPGVAGAILLVVRVGVSVSVAVLLVMTTPWADLLKSLRAIRVPQVFVLVLSMTYRYIFLFLHTVNGIFLARKSRIVARTTAAGAAPLDRRARWAT